MRLAVYTDYTYRRQDGVVYAERAFALFLDALAGAPGIAQLALAGRLEPQPGTGRYPLTDAVDFVALPFYETILRPHQAARQLLASLRRFWRVLDDVDAVWLLGPNPLALLFACQALVRRRTLVLGVRQDTRAYLRTRHPRRRWIWAIGDALEGAWRLLARRVPVVVVGPELAAQYARAPRLLPVAISLVRERDLAEPPPARAYEGEITLLSVGRLETEKNPLLMADILARLNAAAPRWRLTVCGEGPLQEALAQRLAELGVAERADLRGYVAQDDGLAEAYRSHHLLLHVSWTEGLPQILFEAFAAGLPVVATDVGGIRAAVGEATALIPAGDADAAAEALERIADDPARRAELVAAGLAQAREHTLEAETGRVARFVAEALR
ncbi:MAG: glycosyltransferase family 4 protein [Conexibacter sp.]